ncbi:hypothetical protein HOY82DRAFT_544269 [Tuber indicum]|nr:hypothetical protein HOY82DRAFT_544269 [Tuber indicum]
MENVMMINNDDTSIPESDEEPGCVDTHARVKTIPASYKHCAPNKTGESMAQTQRCKVAYSTNSDVLPNSVLADMRSERSMPRFQEFQEQDLYVIETFHDHALSTAFELEELTAAITHPDTIVEALQFPTIVSPHKRTPPVAALGLRELVPRMAGSRVHGNPKDAIYSQEDLEVQLRLIMSYINLHLTLDYPITRHVLLQFSTVEPHLLREAS